MEATRHPACKNNWRQDITKAITANEKTTAFVICVLLFFLAQHFVNISRFVGDANAYWTYSSSILNLDFPKTMRGYFYSLILSPAKLIFEIFPSSGYIGVFVLQALIFSYVTSILLPSVFTWFFGGKISLLRRIAPSVLISIFFPGLIAHTLSDLPALCMLLASIYLAIKSSESQNAKVAALLIFVSGILAYGSYSTRTIYLFSILILTPAIPLIILSHKKNIQRVSFTIIFAAGAAFSSIPQILVNIKHLNTPSPFVITDSNNTSLYANQLKWGVTIQKYETGFNKDTGGIYPIYYLDPVGEKAFIEKQIGQSTTTVFGFIKIIANDPLPFLRIYAKHFINGLDVRDANSYVSTPSKDKKLRSIASISVVVLGLFYLILELFKPTEKSNQHTNRKILFIALLSTPVIAITPGAVETRFFLPLHSLAYCAIAFLCCATPNKKLSPITLIITSTAYLLIVSLLYISANGSVQNPTYEINKDYFE